jgi:hypothetical protein
MLQEKKQKGRSGENGAIALVFLCSAGLGKVASLSPLEYRAGAACGTLCA